MSMNHTPFGDLSIIAMKGCEEFVGQVDAFLKEWHGTDESFIVKAECPRFGSGEAKGLLRTTMRGRDVFIVRTRLTGSICHHNAVLHIARISDRIVNGRAIFNSQRDGLCAK